MKKIILFIGSAALVTFSSCKKENNDDNNPSGGSTVSSTQVLTDFAHVMAYPNYLDIQAKANALNTAILTLDASTTDANLTAAKNAWRAVRASWEQSEAFLFGPVEDFNYDPTMDTWPVNWVDMDSLLASSNPLTLSDIDNLIESLKGFHPIEYILFGIGGTRLAVDLTARQKLYMVSLSQSLYNTTTALRNSWDTSQPGNFTQQVVTAGNGSTRYASRKDALIAIVSAMAGICDEVANGKMEEPLAMQDSSLEESPFSHSSTADFKNNITGIRNVYLGKYTADGHGMNDLVNAKNISLDNTLQSQMNAAINSFNAISSNYGAAIYTQQIQIHNAQNAINALKNTLETDLMNFVLANVND